MCRSAALVAFVSLQVVSSLAAADLPGVDLSGLTAQQRAAALKVLHEKGCPCGCSMKLDECRVKDPGCGYSTNLAKLVVDSVKAGKGERETIAAVDASPWSRGAQQVQTKLLDDPINVPTYGAPARGPANAPVTLVEFSDFQCPYCAVASVQIEQFLKEHGKQAKLLFKQYPLENHPQAPLAAAAALAANKQGKFWEMHDALFAHRDDLSRPTILGIAKSLGLDTNRFEADWESGEVREQIVRDTQDGDSVRVEGTPTLFINGQRFNGQITAAALGTIADEPTRYLAHLKK